MIRVSAGTRRFLALAAAAVGLAVWQAAGPRTFLPGDVAAVAAGPAQGILAVMGRSVSGWCRAIVRARHDAMHVEQLEAELTRLRQENLALAEQRLENRRLRRLLRLTVAIDVPTVAASVIGYQVRPKGRLLIDRGRRDGITVGAAVIAPRGVLGQVERASLSSAWVVPLVAQSMRAAALVERTRQAGVVVGVGRGYRMQEMELGADLQPGDLVITSGLGGIYPKGIAVGRIASVHRERGLSRTSAEVRPLVNWRDVEEVLVVRD